MTKQQADNRARLFSRLSGMGFNKTEAEALLKIERALQRWGELECGDSNDYGSWAIERDETTGKPFMVRHFYRHGRGKDTVSRSPIPDREAGALRRLAAIMAGKDGLQAYHQGDCRGCNLYIVRTADLKGRAVDSSYNVGVAVCY